MSALRRSIDPPLQVTMFLSQPHVHIDAARYAQEDVSSYIKKDGGNALRSVKLEGFGASVVGTLTPSFHFGFGCLMTTEGWGSTLRTVCSLTALNSLWLCNCVLAENSRALSALETPTRLVSG